MGSKKSKAAKNPYGVQPINGQQQLYPGSYYQPQPQYYQQQPQIIYQQSPSFVLPPPPPPIQQLPPIVGPLPPQQMQFQQLPPIVGPLPPQQQFGGFPGTVHHHHHQRRPRGPRVIDEPPIPLHNFH